MIDDFTRRNYARLETVAKNITGSKSKWSHNRSQDAADLLGFMWLHVYENRDKYDGMDDKHLEATCIMIMKNQWRWTNSKFNSTVRITESRRADGKEVDIADTSERIDIIAEDAPQQAIDHIMDLCSQGFSQEQIENLLRIKIAKTCLNIYEQSIFELYFTKGLSFREIEKMTGVPHSSIHKVYVAMKSKLLKKMNKIK